MLVTDLLRQNALRFPDETALVSIDTGNLIVNDSDSYPACRRSLTWRQFDESANRVANYLLNAGVRRGGKVGIMMMNRMEYISLYFGILRAGAVSVQLNFRYQAPELVWSAQLTDLEALVFDRAGREAVSQVRSALPQIHTYISFDEAPCGFAASWQEVLSAPAGGPGVVLNPADDAVIYFSSGTTGTPKAVVHSHATIEAACILEQSNHRQVHGDTFLLIPPLYHMGGKFHWIGNLLCGARGVLMLGFRSDAFFEILRREQVTITFLLLPWIQDILAAPDGGDAPPKSAFPFWRLLHTGAQPIPPVVIRRLRRRFPQLECQISYGLTESGGPGCLNLSGDRMDKLGSVGRASQGWEAKVVDSRGNTLPPGEDGELLIRSAHMMSRYYKDPVSTEKAFCDGWLRTGDVARMDQDGFFYIDGRMKDVIISGGENIYPVPIEGFLRGHPAVKDAAVFGICDCRMGEAAAAKVCLTQPGACTEGELLAFCQKLPKFQRPRKIFFGEVPRNPTGKIDKAALRREYSPKHPFQDNIRQE